MPLPLSILVPNERRRRDRRLGGGGRRKDSIDEEHRCSGLNKLGRFERILPRESDLSATKPLVSRAPDGASIPAVQLILGSAYRSSGETRRSAGDYRNQLGRKQAPWLFLTSKKPLLPSELLRRSVQRGCRDGTTLALGVGSRPHRPSKELCRCPSGRQQSYPYAPRSCCTSGASSRGRTFPPPARPSSSRVRAPFALATAGASAGARGPRGRRARAPAGP
jgi:hypothetical protein